MAALLLCIIGLAIGAMNQMLDEQIFSKNQFVEIDEKQALQIVKQQYQEFHVVQEDEPIDEAAMDEAQIQQMTVNQLADVVAENTYITKKYSVVVLNDQLDKLNAQLEDIESQIASIQENLPPIDSDDECSQYTGCNKCTKSLNCGWCVQEKKCVKGDNIGPMNTICNFYNYLYCSGQTCIKFFDCGSCLSDPKCGWCEDQVHMAVTCLEQPGSFTGCPAAGWFHAEGEKNSCPTREKPPVENIYNLDEDPNKKKKKKKKGDEPMDRFRPKTWEENVQDEKAKILQDRQLALQGSTPSEKQLSLDKASQDLDLLEQQRLSVQQKIANIEKQIAQFSPADEGQLEE